ncbi:hypothetical protein GCM10023228_31770 [Brevibacillus fulvus]
MPKKHTPFADVPRIFTIISQFDCIFYYYRFQPLKLYVGDMPKKFDFFVNENKKKQEIGKGGRIVSTRCGTNRKKPSSIDLETGEPSFWGE